MTEPEASKLEIDASSVDRWAQLEVVRWLKHVGLSDMTTAFLAERVSGSDLLALTSEFMFKNLNLHDGRQRKQLMKQIQLLNRQYQYEQKRTSGSLSSISVPSGHQNHSETSEFSLPVLTPRQRHGPDLDVSNTSLSPVSYYGSSSTHMSPLSEKSRPSWRPGGVSVRHQHTTLPALKRYSPEKECKSTRRSISPAPKDGLKYLFEKLSHDESIFDEFAKLSHATEYSTGSREDDSSGYIDLNEWHNMLEKHGIVPYHLSKTESVHAFSTALNNSDFRKLFKDEFKEALRILASNLKLSVSGMASPIRRQRKKVMGVAAREIYLLQLGKCVTWNATEAVERYILAREKRDRQENIHSNIFVDSEKEDEKVVGCFKPSFLRGADEKLRYVRVLEEKHNMEVHAAIQELKNKFAAKGIKPKRSMRS